MVLQPVLTPDDARPMRPRTGPAIGLLAIGFGCALLTFVFFANYPAFAQGHRGPALAGLWTFAFAALLVSAPLLWLIALAGRMMGTLAPLEIHAALYGVLLFITLIVDSPGHSSPAEGFRGLVILGLVAVMAIEGAVLAIALARTSPQLEDSAGFLAPALAAALFGGWIVGVLAWSSLLPPRVIAAAEAAAGDRPYCIDVDGRPARRAADLDALSMRATNAGGWTFNFHALLVIGAGQDRRYMNWSYRSGRFEPVSHHAREALHLDKEARCTPLAHLARDW